MTQGPIVSGSPEAPINAGALFTVLRLPGKNPPLALLQKMLGLKENSREFAGMGDM